tara:strand:- start:1084 stop:1467 length:384 start_codon:yes stop_codon:yes gene_type:complete
MIKNFLVINCTGKNNVIALRINNNFFFKKLQTNMRSNELLVNNIFSFIKQKKANVDKNFTIIVNLGPGSFSSIRIAIAVAKGIKITSGAKLYGYRDQDLANFNARNIGLLIKKKLIQNNLIKPVYLS